MLAAALAELDEKYVGEPTLSDLVQVIEDRPLRLQEAAYDEGSDQRYRETVRGLIRTIRSMLAPHGEMGDLFAHRTTTRIDIEGPACFDTSSIPEDQTKLVAAALTACWQQGFAAVNTRVALGLAGVMAMKHYNVVVDETWRVHARGALGDGRPDQRAHAPEPADRLFADDGLPHHPRSAVDGRGARAHQSARVHSTLRDAFDRRAAARGVRPSAPGPRVLRQGAALPAGLAGRRPAQPRRAGRAARPAASSCSSSGHAPGIPLQIALTHAERDVRIHETSTAWKVPSR